MLEWERYDKETWGIEWHDIDRLALIKETSPDEFTLIVGTVKDAEYISKAATLSHAKAKAIRYMMLLLNNADADKLKWKI